MNEFLNWTELKLESVWHKAEKSVGSSRRDLSIIRIIYGLFILTLIHLDFSWLGNIPQGLFLPNFLSLSNLFHGFPSYITMRTIEIILVLLGLCILLGIKSRWAGVVFVITYIIGNSFNYSFGKINHDLIFFITFLLGLSFTNWGVNNAIIPDRQVPSNTQRKILTVLAIMLCFGMFTAGFEKAIHWVDFDLETGGFLSWFYGGYFTLQRNDFLAPLILHLPSQIFELADYTAVVFELSPLLALLAGRKWWLGWLLIACCFHLANTLILNINFISHAPVYLTFISLPGMILRSNTANMRLVYSRKLLIFISSTAFFIILHYSFIFFTRQSIVSPLSHIIDLLTKSQSATAYLTLTPSLFIWVVSILLIALNLFNLLLSSGQLITEDSPS